MDPLSIAAGASGLVGVCIKISATLYTFIEDSLSVDSNVTGLCDEILGLSRVLDAISKSWRQSPLIAVAQADPDGNLWVSVKASIDDCKKTLEKLDRELNNVQKESLFGRGFMRRPAKQIKLNMKMKDIQLFRQQLQSYSSGMQSALQMINLCLLIHGQSSQDLVMRGLEGLKSQIGRVEHAIDSQKANPSEVSSADIQDNERISQTLQRLVRAAESFHSSASTVAGGSTVWGGSVMGEPLNQEQFRSIEEWISQPIEEETTADHTSDSTRVTSPLTDISTNPPTQTSNPTTLTEHDRFSASNDSDSDIENDMIKKFEELAVAKLEQRDYAKAEIFFRKIIDRGQGDGALAEDLPLIKSKIACTCCFQGRWEEAEFIIVPIAMAKDCVDINAFHLLHTFAIRKFQQGQVQDATRWCKRALWGKKKLLGKKNVSYYESMALLARIYDSQGENIEAEACRSFIPPTTSVDQDPLSYLFKTISEGKSPARPPTTSNSSNSNQIIAPLIQLTTERETTGRETPPLPQTSEPANTPFRSRFSGSLAASELIRPNRPIQTVPKLPPGWESRQDELGQTYYLDHNTRQTTWQPPETKSNLSTVAESHWGPSSNYSRSLSSLSASQLLHPNSGPSSLVICVDFGVTFSGIAYYVVDDTQNENIRTISRWPGTSQYKAKIPSVLYYQDDKVVGWGPDIADALAPTGYPKPGVQKVEWFSLHLITNSDSHIDLINLPPLPSGKTSVDVAADYLFRLRIAMQSFLHSELGSIFDELEKQIRWCFTVSPCGNDASMASLRSAIVQAGYIQDGDNGRLTLVSETEAALFWGYKIGLGSPIHLNDVIICVDCGGGLVNLTSYEMINESPPKFREVTEKSGDSCGSTAINRNFSNFLRAKIRRAKLPEGSQMNGRIYAMNLMDFENRIKGEFRNDGRRWSVRLGAEAEYPEADIGDGNMTWTNDEIFEVFETVILRILELIRNQINAIQAKNKAPQHIMVFGGFGESEYLLHRIKLDVPSQYSSKVVRPTDSLLATVKGGIVACLNEITTKETKQMYLMETLEIFKPDIDPEYYRLASLDGLDRCRYSWRTAINIGAIISRHKPMPFAMQKLVAPGDSLLFEDAIFCSTTLPPPYVVMSDAQIVSKITTNLTHKSPDEDFEKDHGPHGPYYKIDYDLVFTFDGDKWSIKSIFKDEVVGSCSVDFK